MRPVRRTAGVTGLVLGVVLSACAQSVGPSPTVGGSAPSAAPVATPSATLAESATPADSSSPEAVADHVSTSVASLLALTTQADIGAWIETEQQWLTTVPSTDALRGYSLALRKATGDVAFAADPNDMADVLEAIRTAALNIPGVAIPEPSPGG